MQLRPDHFHHSRFQFASSTLEIKMLLRETVTYPINVKEEFPRRPYLYVYHTLTERRNITQLEDIGGK